MHSWFKGRHIKTAFYVKAKLELVKVISHEVVNTAITSDKKYIVFYLPVSGDYWVREIFDMLTKGKYNALLGSPLGFPHCASNFKTPKFQDWFE